MHSEKHFREFIERELENLELEGKPRRLYDPIRYMINLGGKRLRPVLLLMSHELFNENISGAIHPALGIEVFHNFTLLHDDIMDKAPLRRSKETVHLKWNPDIAILSGDTMFVQSCRLLMQVKPEYLSIALDMFFKTAIDVCEGQQMDMDYEREENVSIDDYLEMISKKTASLIGCSAGIGALCSGARQEDYTRMYSFGKNLGLAFQLHDDILDVYADAGKFGKQIGGDILSNKKTILLLTALQKADNAGKTELTDILQSTNFLPEKKIESVVSIYEKLDVRKYALQKMDYFFNIALNELDAINAPEENKKPLRDLAEKMMVRER